MPPVAAVVPPVAIAAAPLEPAAGTPPKAPPVAPAVPGVAGKPDVVPLPSGSELQAASVLTRRKGTSFDTRGRAADFIAKG
jgi:hypothetical protein